MSKNTTKQTEIELRRKQVQRLYLQKHTIADISRILSVNKRTIDRDLEQIREENNVKVQGDLNRTKDVQNIISENIQALSLVTNELWRQYEDGETSITAKVKILNSIRETQLAQFEIYKKIGLTHEAHLHNETDEMVELGVESRNQLANEFTEFIKNKYQYPRNINQVDQRA